MGSRPWIDRCMSGLLSSERYRNECQFTITHGSRSLTGLIECGESNGRKVIYVEQLDDKGRVVAEDWLPLTRNTLIDGVPAPVWTENDS